MKTKLYYNKVEYVTDPRLLLMAIRNDDRLVGVSNKGPVKLIYPFTSWNYYIRDFLLIMMSIQLRISCCHLNSLMIFMTKLKKNVIE